MTWRSDGALMEQQRESPRFYQIVAIIFLLIGSVLIALALKRHDWILGIFAGITILNAFMAMLKFMVARETGR
jgi:hypothetical protein